jgi:hypothetical protein
MTASRKLEEVIVDVDRTEATEGTHVVDSAEANAGPSVAVIGDLEEHSEEAIEETSAVEATAIGEEKVVAVDEAVVRPNCLPQ